VVEPVSEIGLAGGWARRNVARVGHKWGKFDNAGTDCMPITGTPDENHFAMLRTSELDVDWVPFLKSKK